MAAAVQRQGPGPAAHELVPLGIVAGAWGVQGCVRIALYAADGEVLQQRPAHWWLLSHEPPRSLRVQATKRRGATLMAHWEGVDSKEAADALKGAEIAVPRSEFPELPAGEHYWADLVGRRVMNRQQVHLGDVVGLREVGPAQWIEVAGAGGTRLIPWVEQYVEAIEPGDGVILVDWQEDW